MLEPLLTNHNPADELLSTNHVTDDKMLSPSDCQQEILLSMDMDPIFMVGGGGLPEGSWLVTVETPADEEVRRLTRPCSVLLDRAEVEKYRKSSTCFLYSHPTSSKSDKGTDLQPPLAVSEPLLQCHQCGARTFAGKGRLKSHMRNNCSKKKFKARKLLGACVKELNGVIPVPASEIPVRKEDKPLKMKLKKFKKLSLKSYRPKSTEKTVDKIEPICIDVPKKPRQGIDKRIASEFSSILTENEPKKSRQCSIVVKSEYQSIEIKPMFNNSPVKRKHGKMFMQSRNNNLSHNLPVKNEQNNISYCVKCKNYFESVFELEKHEIKCKKIKCKKIKFDTKPISYACTVCFSQCFSMNALKIHTQRAHTVTAPEISSVNVTLEEIVEKVPENTSVNITLEEKVEKAPEISSVNITLEEKVEKIPEISSVNITLEEKVEKAPEISSVNITLEEKVEKAPEISSVNVTLEEIVEKVPENTTVNNALHLETKVPEFSSVNHSLKIKRKFKRVTEDTNKILNMRTKLRKVREFSSVNNSSHVKEKIQRESEIEIITVKNLQERKRKGKKLPEPCVNNLVEKRVRKEPEISPVDNTLEKTVDRDVLKFYEKNIKNKFKNINCIHCITCNKDLSLENYFMTHFKKCYENSDFLCPFCTRMKSHIPEKILTHIKKHLTSKNLQITKCTQCKKSFPNPFNQSIHLNKQHLGVFINSKEVPEIGEVKTKKQSNNETIDLNLLQSNDTCSSIDSLTTPFCSPFINKFTKEMSENVLKNDEKQNYSRMLLKETCDDIRVTVEPVVNFDDVAHEEVIGGEWNNIVIVNAMNSPHNEASSGSEFFSDGETESNLLGVSIPDVEKELIQETENLEPSLIVSNPELLNSELDRECSKETENLEPLLTISIPELLNSDLDKDDKETENQETPMEVVSDSLLGNDTILTENTENMETCESETIDSDKNTKINELSNTGTNINEETLQTENSSNPCILNNTSIANTSLQNIVAYYPVKKFKQSKEKFSVNVDEYIEYLQKLESENDNLFANKYFVFCNSCHTSFYLIDYVKHLLICLDNEEFSCSFCSEFCDPQDTKAKCLEHIKEHFVTDDETDCFLCGDLFLNEFNMMKHTSAVHKLDYS